MNRHPARSYRPGSEHPRAKLTDADVIAARGMFADGARLQTIADRFGIKVPYASRLVRGLNWAHLPGACPARRVSTVKLDDAKIILIRRQHVEGMTVKDLAKRHGVTLYAIQCAVLRPAPRIATEPPR